MRATHITFYRRARSVRCRVADHTSTSVELDTRYDQRPIDLDISSPTARVMVPRGLDKGLTNRLSSRPGRRRQCAIAAMLQKTSRRGFYSYTPYGNAHGIRGREQIRYDNPWHVQFRTISTYALVIHMDTVVVNLNCQAILGMDILGDATKLSFILDLVDGTLSGGGYETIQLHRFHAATECFAETAETVCIPPHSEVMLWAKQKTNNGRRGPTAGVVLELQIFVQEFGILVGRSLVCADADDWKVPILLYNSDPCTRESKHCKCNLVIIPARTRIARVEEIQAIQNIDQTQHKRGQTSTPLDRRARRSKWTYERPARAQPICWLNISTSFRPLGPR